MKTRQYANAHRIFSWKLKVFILCMAMSILAADIVFAVGEDCDCYTTWWGAYRCRGEIVCDDQTCVPKTDIYSYREWVGGWFGHWEYYEGDLDNGVCDEYLNCPEFDNDNDSCARCYLDNDNDTFGGAQAPCGPGTVDNDLDCNDGDDTIYPGAPEECDGIDNDCANGPENPNDDPHLNWQVYFQDSDGDTYGAGTNGVLYCNSAFAIAAGYNVTRGGDCDDSNKLIHPGANEVCDCIDNNCENGVDENCPTTTYYRDDDGDGFPINDSQTVSSSCPKPDDYIEYDIVNDALDCDDTNILIYPGAAEECDGIDNDCANGPENRDDDPHLDWQEYFQDSDGDTYGFGTTGVWYCSDAFAAADDYTVTRGGDCDDSKCWVYPGSTEICGNGDDDDCAGDGDKLCVAGDDCDCTLNGCVYDCDGVRNCDNDGCVAKTYLGNGTCDPDLQCAANHWDGGDCPVVAECYRDVDIDGYGGLTTTDTANKDIITGLCPTGYVDNNLDCDDDNFDIKPGVLDDNCDMIDDDCDGIRDEDSPIYTYYQDGDGDGYGNASVFMDACAPPANFVADSSDCDDTNADIHPGAFDLCENGVDEDCNNADRLCSEPPNVCANLSDFPLETQVESAPPIVMLLMDDSGSMAWSNLCPEDNGLFSGNDNYWDTGRSWQSQWAGYNGIYYNPDQSDYEPWPDTGTATYDDADMDTPKYHPNGTSTLTLNNEFMDRDGVSVRWSHYYVWSSSPSPAPYLVNIVKNNDGTYRLDYYKVTCDNAQCSDPDSIVDYYHGFNDAVRDTNPPADVVSGRTPAEERQNFANWFQYYRTRQLTAIAAIAQVVNSVDGMKIGLHTINQNNSIDMIAPRFVDNNRGPILDDLYDVGANSGTPLRRGLRDVGNYYAGTYQKNYVTLSTPYSDSSDGGECQQAYTIMMTDGYYNGSDPNVGNADKDDDGSQIDGFDGGEFADNFSNTLADVAMYYYEHDLNSTLENVVPASPKDNIAGDTMHQHMVTYSISFGLSGLYDPDDYSNCPGTVNSCPDWPDVDEDDEDEKSITDLWHAAVNGRGRYMEATNAQQLAYALVALMQEVSKESGQGASVAVNSQKLKQGTSMYQGTYNSAGWSGDLRAFAINTDGTVNQTFTWSAAGELKTRIQNSGHTDRNIYTMGASGGVEFLYSNIGSLTNFQQNALGSDAVARENIMNFIRGDVSNDKNNNGSLRVRNTPLGDIVHSAPKFVKNYLYVGANDGMFHVFNASTGAEVFAYIPSFVYGNLPELANPDYTHRYYADSTAFIGYYGSDVLLVSGVGKGGKGYFCLDIDIDNPASFSYTNVKWEFPNSLSSASEIDNLGYTFSEPVIIKTESAGEVVIFGNGYDSLNASAVLYALNPSDGDCLTMVDTGYGSPTFANNNCNGLSTPVFIDSNNNGKADYAYAGDLQGNVWKFDISGAVTDWEVVYQDGGGNPKALFQALDSAGNPQPITTRVAVRGHCVRGYSGYMVLFGTGKFNAAGDFSDTSTQAVYGIWDWAAEWDEEDTAGDSSDKYLGAYNSPGAGQLSNMAGHTDLAAAGAQLTLVSQSQSGGTVNYSDETWGFTSSNTISWFNVEKFLDTTQTYGDEADEGYHVGWTYALPVTAERVVADPILWLEYVLIVSQVPATNMCTVGGTSYLTALNVCSGAAPDEPFFDINDDNEITEDDKINGDPPSSIELDEFITYSPTMIEKFIYFGPGESYVVDTDPSRVIFWRFLDMD